MYIAHCSKSTKIFKRVWYIREQIKWNHIKCSFEIREGRKRGGEQNTNLNWTEVTVLISIKANFRAREIISYQDGPVLFCFFLRRQVSMYAPKRMSKYN